MPRLLWRRCIRECWKLPLISNLFRHFALDQWSLIAPPQSATWVNPRESSRRRRFSRRHGLAQPAHARHSDDTERQHAGTDGHGVAGDRLLPRRIPKRKSKGRDKGQGQGGPGIGTESINNQGGQKGKNWKIEILDEQEVDWRPNWIDWEAELGRNKSGNTTRRF